MGNATALRIVEAEHPASVSYNLVGQRLGKKGQETRQRIIDAMLRLLADRSGPPVMLSSVAREAGVRLTNLYLYFPDLGTLLLAALETVMASAGDAYLDQLRTRWPDDALEKACLWFLRAHCEFWDQNTRLLHLRNAYADANDQNILRYRHQASWPLIELLMQQMDGNVGDVDQTPVHVATVLLTGLERIATVLTNPDFHQIMQRRAQNDDASYIDKLLQAEALVILLAIQHQRASARS